MTTVGKHEASLVGAVWNNDTTWHCLHRAPFAVRIDNTTKETASVLIEFNGIEQGLYGIVPGQNVYTHSLISRFPFVFTPSSQYIRLTLKEKQPDGRWKDTGILHFTLVTPPTGVDYASNVYGYAIQLALNQDVHKALDHITTHMPRDMVVHREAIMASLNAYAASVRVHNV